MLPLRTLEQSLQKIPACLQDIVFELRNIIARQAPGVSEVGNRRGFNYYYKERGGPVSAGVCLLSLHDDHVRLSFIHGSFLPDPLGLLQGDALYKRYLCLSDYENIPWDAIKDMITASARFDPHTLEFH